MTTTVLHLIGSLDRGGAETVALDLCRRMPPDEVRQVFVCLSGRTGSMADSFRTAGAVVDAAGFRTPVGAIRVVRAAIRRHRPDTVISHVSLASGPLLAAAWSAGVRNRIARLHSEGDGRGKSIPRRVYRAVARAMLVASATRIVAVSRAGLHFGVGRWEPLVRRRTMVLGNGVDPQRFAPEPRREHPLPRIIHVGRGSPEKNRAALAPIFRALDRTVESRWWIVGPGDPADLGPLPSDRFEVLGDRSDVPDMLRASDVLILPSLREGLPGVILEALSTGVPAVASDLETLRELAGKLPGITLVAPDAPPDTWARQIAAAIERRPADAAALRRAVTESEYTLERSVRDWRGLMEAG